MNECAAEAGGGGAFSFLPSEGKDETLPAATPGSWGKKVRLLYRVQAPTPERRRRLTRKEIVLA